MPHKNYILDDEIPVKVVKNSKSKNIRLSIKNDGSVRVSIPNRIPFNAGIKFALSKIEWIRKKRVLPDLIFNNQLIGKSHRINFIPKDTLRTSARINDLQINVIYPMQLSTQDEKIQERARIASKKVLLKEAEQLLPFRVKHLADKHQYRYKSISVKFTKSRWGSCDNQKNLIFNPNLMNLPWELIDYVIIHELSHTIHLHHQKNFWDEVENRMPNYKLLRKRLKETKSNY